MTEHTETKDPPYRIGWKMGVAGLAAIAFIGYSMTTTGADEPSQPEYDGIPRHEAWGACQDSVKGHLTNPATADFRVLTADDERNEDGYKFSGALTAQNSFGVEQNLIYSCDVTPEGFATSDVRNAD